MKSHAVAALAFALLAAAVTAGAGDDAKKMDGTWLATIVESDGKPATEAEKGLKFKVVVEAGKYKTYVQDQYVAAGTLKLDASKKPRTIDATYTDGEFKGVVQRGVYELDGDTMTINFAKPGKERPEGMKTKEGTEQVLLRYTREKK